MIDYFNTPDKNTNTQIFYSNASGYTSFQVWQKPNNAKMVYIMVIGSGGGGGGGRTGSVNTGTGGGGGASGGITHGLFPAAMLPDYLHVYAGRGGRGGGAGIAGGSGEISYVSLSAGTGAIGVLVQSSLAAAGGGGGGTSSVIGSAGVAATLWTYTSNIFPQLGHITTIAGQAGGAGGPNGNVGVSVVQALPISGGAGGGGESSTTTSYNGGSITSTMTGFITITGGTANSTININGMDGIEYGSLSPNWSTNKPLMFLGGAGGGGANTASRNAGHGGDGQIGSGGGGGGAAYQGTGGTGGNGGDGLVIIACW